MQVPVPVETSGKVQILPQAMGPAAAVPVGAGAGRTGMNKVPSAAWSDSMR